MWQYKIPRHTIMFADLSSLCQSRILEITGISSPEEVGWEYSPIAYSRGGWHSSEECDKEAIKVFTNTS
jgi:hypothetical protein